MWKKSKTTENAHGYAKKIVAVLPFLIMPAVIPIYMKLDSTIFLEIFGCGCVPFIQTNMLNIPFNANDLRLTVFALLTFLLSIWSINISDKFKRKITKYLYRTAVIVINGLLALWFYIAFMWA